MSKHPWARHREQKLLTQETVAEELHVNRQTVIRLEQGLFHAPSEEILEKLQELYEVGSAQLRVEYDCYKREQRKEFATQHPTFSQVLYHYKGAEHPLVYYRSLEDLSRMGLCRGLCLDYSPVADYEMNKQRGIPQEIILACNEIGWDYGSLESAVSEWRSDGRADK